MTWRPYDTSIYGIDTSLFERTWRPYDTSIYGIDTSLFDIAHVEFISGAVSVSYALWLCVMTKDWPTPPA